MRSPVTYMIEAIDTVWVDGALLVSLFSLYGYDASCVLEVYAAHPNASD